MSLIRQMCLCELNVASFALFQNVVPYIVIHLIFGLMWWLRDINIQNEYFVAQAASALALPPAGNESMCGWVSLRDSQSGRLQVRNLHQKFLGEFFGSVLWTLSKFFWIPLSVGQS